MLFPYPCLRLPAENDMFWSEPWDEEGAMKACESQWGVRPRKLWATTE